MEWKWIFPGLGALFLALSSLPSAGGAPQAAHGDLDRRIREVAGLPGEPSAFESAGVTRGDVPLRSVESREPADGPQRRLVILGGLDGNDRSVDAVLGALRWFKTEAPASLRQA